MPWIFGIWRTTLNVYWIRIPVHVQHNAFVCEFFIFFFLFFFFLFSSNETVHTTSTHNIHTCKHSITYALHNEYIKHARLYLHVKGYVSNYIKSPHLPSYISIWLFMTQIPFSVLINFCSCSLYKLYVNLDIQGESKKMSPLTKCDTIAPHLEINEIRFRYIDPDVHADMWYKNGIDWSRNAWAMSAWKRRTTFAPTQGLHISGYVPSRHRYCKSHISAYEWKIWIITTRQLRVYVTLCFPYFSHPYFIKAMESHIG